VLSAETIERYGEEINAKVVALNTIHLPLEERSTDDKRSSGHEHLDVERGRAQARLLPAPGRSVTTRAVESRHGSEASGLSAAMPPAGIEPAHAV
jgi:hypothetical protein